ncbi:DUF6519 domain-containing protein [uncultured Bradyrhizobium sp.]|uniref:DUF6519 domain-containing protein n=1 Tax=uncultured Bradyrhizobium sp. TaxID=199684 RepID=UPI0035CA3F94
MSGDYSRIAFDPSQNYGGVLLQQGRPLTDRDWNDQTAAVDRRAQAGTLDASGPVLVSGETPDAFKILPGLLIGRGRMYVDGLLADNHGTGLPKWDGRLAERFGADPIAFDKQPHLPGAVAPPETGGPYLVYLDVWNREVTQFEDSKLVEIALGVDTTTRVQTIWQVKWLDKIGAGTTCATPPDQIPAWVAATEPSAGRLTTATAPVANPDPCLVPPMGGYKGLENQLYRVEVHSAGPLGTATFKWSRDNASIEARVTRVIDSLNFVVDSVGKDGVLRFSDGDWIEITDDTRELNGQAGELHKIKVGGGVDDATRTITLDQKMAIDLGPDGQGNLDPVRNARIRRWDQKGKIVAQDGSTHVDLDAVAGTGAIPVPAGGLSLRIEDGIIVTFSAGPGGGNFHVGDYWTFAARSADASVEILDSAPPRGIHHHYAKLAVYTPQSGLEDCRPKKTEEECCCTMVVSPGGDIQAAINALPDGGGCVCLKTGIHHIERGIVIARSNVTLAGESHGTIVRGQQGTVLTLNGKDNGIEGIEISMIAFEQNQEAVFAPPTPAPVLAAANVRRSAILDCAAKSKQGQTAIGIQLTTVDEFRIARCRIEQTTTAIFASGLQTRMLYLEDNVIDLSADTAKTTTLGIVLMQIAGPGRITGNSLRGITSEIVVNGQIAGTPQPSAGDVMVTGNVVVCAPAPPASTVASAGLFGIDLAANSSIVSQNLLQLPGTSTAHAGIRITGDNIGVLDNQIVPVPGADKTDNGFIGIQIGDRAALTSDIRVAGNLVNAGRAGIVVTSSTGIIVESNVVKLGEGAINAGIALGTVKGGRVKNNQVSGSTVAILCSAGGSNQVTGNMLANSRIGVAINREITPVIAHNRIEATTSAGIQCAAVTGRCDIVGNRIASCGFRIAAGSGILATQMQGELHIEDNEVMDTGISPDGRVLAPLAFGIAGTSILEASIENNTIGYTDPAGRPASNEDRALTMTCLLEQRESPTGPVGYPIQILGNKFTGPGKTALVEIQEQPTGNRLRFERVFFSNNYCLHYPFYAAGAATAKHAGTVSLFGRVATVMGNQIKALRPSGNAAVFASVNFNGMPGPFIGNVTSGDVVQHTQFPSPQTGFNLIA